MKYFELDLENAQLPSWWPSEMPAQLPLIHRLADDLVLTLDESIIPKNTYQELMSALDNKHEQFFFVDTLEMPVGSTLAYIGEYTI